MMTFKKYITIGMNNFTKGDSLESQEEVIMSQELLKNHLSICFRDAKKETTNFKRQTYPEIIDQLYTNHVNTFAELEKYFHMQNDDYEVLRDISTIFAKTASDELDLLSKRKRSMLMLDYNMTMVTFILPLLGRRREPFIDIFADMCVEEWNKTFPTTKIEKSTQADIQGGFKTGLCYISTAVCKSQNKADDCYELNLLRNYRDDYLIKDTSDGMEIITEYYDIAPTIVNRINRDINATSIYDDIWMQYLQPCIHMIEDGKKEESKELYINMVQNLSLKYFH